MILDRRSLQKYSIKTGFPQRPILGPTRFLGTMQLLRLHLGGGGPQNANVCEQGVGCGCGGMEGVTSMPTFAYTFFQLNT